MKNYFKYYLLLSIILFSCKKDKTTPQPTINIGSLTAEIDTINKNFVININKTTIDTGINNGVKFILIEGMDLGSNTLRVSIPSRDTGTYKIAYSIASSCRYTTKQGVIYYGKSGVAKLSKVDFKNKKLSGSFTLKLLKINSQDTIYLKNGVFQELPLPKKQ